MICSISFSCKKKDTTKKDQEQKSTQTTVQNKTPRNLPQKKPKQSNENALQEDTISPFLKKWNYPNKNKHLIIEAEDEHLGKIIFPDNTNKEFKELYNVIHRFMNALKKGKIKQIRSFFVEASFEDFYEFINRPNDLKLKQTISFKIGYPIKQGDIYNLPVKIKYAKQNYLGELDIREIKRNLYIYDFTTDLFLFLVED
jgi:hypothetical protein